MAVLVTGAAGFIGFHTCLALLQAGHEVVGVDNLNDYYDVHLKRVRIAQFQARPEFTFIQGDIADPALYEKLESYNITHVIHLAAQAGVRYSLENPGAYADSNLTGQLNILEFCRRQDALKHLVYASSSSVYGANTKAPFSIDDRVDDPVSLYAATKRSGELMASCYSRLFKIPATGLRFFTVYGPWGRPDMAYFSFTKAIFAGEPITLFNDGNMQRDFTYITDIVNGIISAMDHPPSGDVPHRLFNLGNHRVEQLAHFVEVLEKAIGKKAEIRYAPMQKGDVASTWADIDATTRELGYKPVTTIEQGLPRFIEWYKTYYKS